MTAEEVLNSFFSGLGERPPERRERSHEERVVATAAQAVCASQGHRYRVHVTENKPTKVSCKTCQQQWGVR